MKKRLLTLTLLVLPMLTAGNGWSVIGVGGDTEVNVTISKDVNGQLEALENTDVTVKLYLNGILQGTAFTRTNAVGQVFLQISGGERGDTVRAEVETDDGNGEGSGQIGVDRVGNKAVNISVIIRGASKESGNERQN